VTFNQAGTVAYFNSAMSALGDATAGGNKITNLGAGTAATDAASLSNRLDQFATPTASVAMGSQKITGLANGTTASQDAASVAQVETLIASGANANLPSLIGHALKFLRVNAGETNAEWAEVLPDQSGNSGKVLATDGTDTSWATAQAGLIKISEQVVSSPVASVDFTTGIDGTYDEYELHILKAINETDSTSPALRTSANAGGAWDAGASDYSRTYIQGTGSSVSANSANEAAITLANVLGSDTNEYGVSGIIRIVRPSVAQYCSMRWELSSQNTSGSNVYTIGSALRVANAVVSGIRYLASSGNIESGTFRLYGVQK
jgi:hypothetical protein